MIPSSLRRQLDNVFCGCVEEDNGMVDDNKYTCCRRVGSSILLCGKKKSYFPFQCFVGPDWSAVVLVFVLIIGINAVVLYVVSPIGWPPILLGGVGGCILLFSFAFTVCSDPGIVFKNDFSLGNLGGLHQDVEDPTHSMLQTGSGHHRAVSPTHTMECGHCQFRRPTTARHCVHCGVCVDDLDHHCPWSGKCIGKKNLRGFYIFLYALCFQFYYLVGVFIYWILFAVSSNPVPTGPSFPS
jgi:hypothetical protein